jgi:predicted  nucleic acid-binding Zn-ribbon protein
MEEQITIQMLFSQLSEYKYRLAAFEKELSEVKQQLRYYVSVKENDLQLKGIQTTVNRIEQEVQEAQKRIGEVDNQLVTQEMDAQKQNAALRESQASLQIRVLWGTVSTILTILTSILIGYLTHFIH